MTRGMTVDDIEVFDLIRDERARQDAKWGGPEHDDTHEPEDWADFIGARVVRIQLRMGNDRQNLVQIAALAVAAIESLDRKANVQGGHAGQEGTGEA